MLSIPKVNIKLVNPKGVFTSLTNKVTLEGDVIKEVRLTPDIIKAEKEKVIEIIKEETPAD